MALDFAPYESLKKLLVLEKASLTDYPQLSEIIDRVKAAFEAHIGYSIDVNDYVTTYFQETETRMIYVNALPILAISSVQIDGVEQPSYKITNYGVVLPTKISNVTVTVNHEGGYDDDTYPAAMKEAALIQVCYEYGMVDNIGATITTTDGGSVSRPELGLLKETKRLLDQFQSPIKMMVI